MSEYVHDQKLKRSVVVEDLLSGMSIGTVQADYLLTPLEFEHLKHGKSKVSKWADNILLALIAIGLGVLVDASVSLNEKQTIILNNVDREWKILGAGVILYGIIYFMGKIFPSNRKKVIKDIQEHFENAPKKQQLVKKEEQ